MIELIRRILRINDLDQWVLGSVGIIAVIIAVLDFFDLIHLSSEQLLRMSIIGLGLLMSAVVVLSNRQQKTLSDLGIDLEKFVAGQLNVKVFPKAEHGFAYMAKMFSEAESYIDHASLSPPIPRWYESVKTWEETIEQVALSNKVKMRYIGNMTDNSRLARASKLMKNPKINRYFAAYYKQEQLGAHMFNFAIVDGRELLIGIHGFGQEDNIIGITSEQVATTFEQYFNLLWANAIRFEAHVSQSNEDNLIGTKIQ